MLANGISRGRPTKTASAREKPRSALVREGGSQHAGSQGLPILSELRLDPSYIRRTSSTLLRRPAAVSVTLTQNYDQHYDGSNLT